MKKSMIKKVIAVAMIVVCFSVLGGLVNAYTDTISFGANYAYGYASYYRPGEANKNRFKTKLTGVNYIGMPSGTMPNGATVRFQLHKANDHSVQATYYTFHTYADYNNGTWNFNSFKPNISHTSHNNFVMVSCSGESIGATVTVKWFFTT